MEKDTEKYDKALQEELNKKTSQHLLKPFKRDVHKQRSKKNNYIAEREDGLAMKVCEYLLDAECLKIDGWIPEEYHDIIRDMYIILSLNGGRSHSRYKKLPLCWLGLGVSAGFMEDMVVVMRTISQLGFSSTHVCSIKRLISGYRKYIEDNPDHFRFMFMRFVFNRYNDEDLIQFIISAIKNQDASKRIGLLEDDVDGPCCYALQGVYGHMEYDPRTVKVLTPDSFTDSSISQIGVHFTKDIIAEAIWKREKTSNSRSNGVEIPVGEIVRFDRVIHGLTCVVYENGDYKIAKTHRGIHNRMVHGLYKENVRVKYQSGLVLDIPKIVEMLPTGSVIINELGTLMVTKNIPHECIKAHLSVDNINVFWRVDE
jgi:hypothetical protein